MPDNAEDRLEKRRAESGQKIENQKQRRKAMEQIDIKFQYTEKEYVKKSRELSDLFQTIEKEMKEYIESLQVIEK